MLISCKLYWTFGGSGFLGSFFNFGYSAILVLTCIPKSPLATKVEPLTPVLLTEWLMTLSYFAKIAVPSGTDDVPFNKFAPLSFPHVLPSGLALVTFFTLLLSTFRPPPKATMA